MSWLTPTSDGCILTVKACPRANRTELAGMDPDWLRVRVQAPPVDGKANAELIRFFADQFGISKRAIELLSGDTGRLKRVKLSGITPEVATRILSAAR